MTRNPLALIVLTLAMMLAPLGVCVAQGHTHVTKSASPMHHHATAQGTSRQMHGAHHGSGSHHFCPDCQPPSYVGASKAGPDLGPVPAVAPVVQSVIMPMLYARDTSLAHLWYGRAPPRPPTSPITTRVRLQI